MQFKCKNFTLNCQNAPLQKLHTSKTTNEELSGKLAHTQISCYGPHNVSKHYDAKNCLQEAG